MSYRIKTVSELTGIPKNTLVAWERRYGTPSPERALNGYRVYSEHDVAELVEIKSALDDGLKISEAIERVAKPSGRRLGRERGPFTAPHAAALPSPETVQRDLLCALLDFDRPRADALLRRLVGTPFPFLIDEIFLPTRAQLLQAWRRGHITVAQEHHASSFLRDQLVAMQLSVGSGPEHGVRVACATYPDDHHEIPVLGLSIRLALAGCHVTYLGANLPAEALVTFAHEHVPAWLCVSVIEPTSADALLDYIDALRRGLSGRVNIAVGGSGVPDTMASARPEKASTHCVRRWQELPLLRAAAGPRDDVASSAATR
ncbi:MAG: MerR family transcriptional regulator [Myxococcota bacterium]